MVNEHDNQYENYNDGNNGAITSVEMTSATKAVPQESDVSSSVATATPPANLQHQPSVAPQDEPQFDNSNGQNAGTVSSGQPYSPTSTSTATVHPSNHHSNMQPRGTNTEPHENHYATNPQYPNPHNSAAVATAPHAADTSTANAQSSITPTMTTPTTTPVATAIPASTPPPINSAPLPFQQPAISQPLSSPTNQPTVGAAGTTYSGQPVHSSQLAPPVQPPQSNQWTTPVHNGTPSTPNPTPNNGSANNHKVAFAIIGSGLFLTIIICIGIFLYYPTAPATDAPTADSTKTTESIDSIGLLQDNQPIPVIPSTLPQSIVSDIERQLESAVAEQSEVAIDVDRAPATTATTATIETPSSAGERDIAQPSTPQTGRIISQRQPGVTSAQKITPSTAPPAAQRSTGTSNRTVANRTEAAPSTAPTPSRLYWIQVVSAKNRDSVQQAHVLLSEHQINGVVSKISDERGTFYRLRVGPFANYQEASKFNQWFSTTTTFDNSFIVTVKNS